MQIFPFFSSRSHSQSGQVGIAVVLIMVVLSTIGLSVATRSSSDVRTSRQTQEATQTFSAAEAALEDVLRQGEDFLEVSSGGSYDAIENVSVTYNIEKQSELTTELLEGAVAEVDISAREAEENDLVIEWSNEENCDQNPASLLVSVINDGGAEPFTRYYAYAICDRADGFTVVNDSGTLFARQVVLPLEANDSVVRILPAYNDTQVSVAGNGWALPTQQFTVSSVAQNELGRETKAIEVQRTRGFAPGILDYALVSGTNIIK